MSEPTYTSGMSANDCRMRSYPATPIKIRMVFPVTPGYRRFQELLNKRSELEAARAKVAELEAEIAELKGES